MSPGAFSARCEALTEATIGQYPKAPIIETEEQSVMVRTQRTRLPGYELLEARRVLAARLVITELAANGQAALADEDGEPSDWIELFNAGDEPADLTGWHLTDDEHALSKWRFPARSLSPQEYLVVYASGKDRAEPEGQRLPEGSAAEPQGGPCASGPRYSRRVSRPRTTEASALASRKDALTRWPPCGPQ